jgi:RNA polymerase sigma-70 factor (ECF subfamily)
MDNDEDLIAAYVRGDESAFERLVERNLRSVYSFAVRFVGSKNDAEDIAQDTFVKVWKNLKQYSRQSARFRTWLMRVARNTAIDYLRKRKHIPFSKFEDDEGQNFLTDTPDDSPLPEELLMLAQDKKEAERMILKLSPPYREVLLLYYGNDLTFEDVAAILDTSVNTIKSRHRRAIAILRNLLMHRK